MLKITIIQAKRNPRHTIFSNTVSYTKLHFPTKLYQNLAKIAKVSHLGGFWVGWLGGWGGLNMAQQYHRFILFVSLH